MPSSFRTPADDCWSVQGDIMFNAHEFFSSRDFASVDFVLGGIWSSGEGRKFGESLILVRSDKKTVNSFIGLLFFSRW